jgi:diaminohydroxyphosphoribosylaminopyrimidine deaminase/5-amino-6-(5-phosphoribosylamino)uracil reductase
VQEEKARELNRAFVTHILNRRPYVHVKVAQSLDGRINRRHGKRRWITGAESRLQVHRWRAEFDAVLVGAGTVRVDDPHLTVRGVRGRNPAAIILDGRCTISPRAALFAARRNVLVIVERSIAKAKKRRVQALRAVGAVVLALPGGRDHRVPVPVVLRAVYRQNIGSILVEGGGEVFSQFLDAGIVDELSLMIAPEAIGDGLPAFRSVRPASLQLDVLDARHLGRDLLVRARRA